MNFKKVEKKWQKRWADKKAFEANEKSKKDKCYVLEMYPYPSASGLHMGHAFNYTIGDIYARTKRMQGFNVLYPMGFDSFGLPAENAAIKNKSHPKKFTEGAIKNYIKQMKDLGLSYDWSRKIECHKPDFYKWDQWIFLKMLEKGLAYKKKAPVNWCGKCKTVLANEQVRDGKCEHHPDTEVEIKQLEQWFLKITEYADELYEKLNELTEWSDEMKKMQRNWIGKSHGTEIKFKVEKPKERIIFLHGKHGDLKKKTWYTWFKKEMEKKGIEIHMPQLPHTDEPVYGEWMKEIEKLKPDESTIMIGHSRGAVSILRYLEKSSSKKIKKAILIAGRVGEKNGRFNSPGFYDEKGYDYDKIKKKCEDFLFISSKDDAVVPFEESLHNSQKLNSPLMEFVDKGHFTSRIQKFPELVDLISSREEWPIFTTRPDTLFGVTFMVVSAQHPKLMDLVSKEQHSKVQSFLKKIKSTSDYGELDKEGVFTGSYAKNPLSKEKIPIYAGNFVVADYGSGMVMAVPAHDQRDYEFAKKYGIKIKEVVSNKESKLDKQAFSGEGTLVNSEGFDGLKTKEAKEHILNALEMKELGRKTVNFKIRDWLISRQRFWGTPIPIIYCEECGTLPVPESDLPVKLPDEIKFKSEKNPLVDYEKFVNAKCPKCKGKAKRETDTMDTFVNSSWYFLRYCDPKNSKKIFETKKVDYWNPIDTYIGGKEHARGHLIYFRFYTKFLRDISLLNFSEPAKRLFNQGMLHGSDGDKMSKSKGNVILPEEVSKKYGIDTARIFLVSIASPDKDIDWSEKGVEGSLRFVKKVEDYVSKVKKTKSSKEVEHKINKAIKEITQDIEKLKYNFAVIKLRSLFDSLEDEISRKDLESFIKLFSVFCPHVGEELWEKIGNKNFVSLSAWPKADDRRIDESVEREERAAQEAIESINNIKKITSIEEPKVYIYSIPNELEIYEKNKDKIKTLSGASLVKAFAVNDKDKYDPEGKSNKAKPGRPGIFVE